MALQAQGAFMREAAAIRDSAATLPESRMLTAVMRLVASIGDGHTGVIDLGAHAAQWAPVRFALFEDGLWVTSIASEHKDFAGRWVASIGGVRSSDVIARLMTIAHGDNDFNKRQHSAVLSNGSIAAALGLTASADTIRFTVEESGGRTKSVTLRTVTGNGALGWEQYGELETPPQLTTRTAFDRAMSAMLDPAKNADLPLHLRGRRAYWYTYVPDSRTLYFQLNSVTARSRHAQQSLIETWISALTSPDPIDRFVLDLRYNSGGDGSLIPRLVKELAKHEATLAAPGRFFVITSGKTFSAAADMLGELTKYFEPLVVGEPAGAGRNSSGDAGSIRLPFSGMAVSVSTRYSQTVRPQLRTATVIPVNVPARMTGAAYFARRDPSIEAILADPAPFPAVVTLLRDSGAVAATRRWKLLDEKLSSIAWWEPWRWQDLNSLSYQLLESNRIEDALAGFIINTERNPTMWETWDSLGEAQLKAGKRAEALASYRRALQLDPANWNAAEQQRVVAALQAGRNP